MSVNTQYEFAVPIIYCIYTYFPMKIGRILKIQYCYALLVESFQPLFWLFQMTLLKIRLFTIIEFEHDG